MNVVINLPERGTGLPASIRFRADTVVECTIQRDGVDPQAAVHFDVVGCSEDNGSATIVGGAELMTTGKITLHGDAQTAPIAEGQSGPLRIRAMFNGQGCGVSAGFSVCSHPSAVHNGPECLPHIGYENGTVRVGMYVEIHVESDSGVNADLDQVTDQEKVSEGRDHTPLLNGYPAGSDTAEPEPAHAARFDRHRHLLGDIQWIDEHRLQGQAGSWSNDQLDVFVCRRCGVVTDAPAEIPRSGYRITRTVFTTESGRLRFRVRKERRQCAVGPWHSGEGPSGPLEVTLDTEIIAPSEEEQWQQLEEMPILRPGT